MKTEIEEVRHKIEEQTIYVRSFVDNWNYLHITVFKGIDENNILCILTAQVPLKGAEGYNYNVIEKKTLTPASKKHSQ